MKNLFRKLFFVFLRRNTSRQDALSTYVYAKKYKVFALIIRENIKDFLLILLGILSATFGLQGFLLNNHFIDGGVTGISMLISSTLHLPLSVLLVVINLPFIILAYSMVGRLFALKSTLAIIGLAIGVAYLNFSGITNNDVLVAIFGGFFLGSGIGLSIRGGAVLDGTEILAIYLSRKIGVTIGDIIVIINVFIFTAALYFLSIEAALFSMLAYLSASRTLDLVVEGLDEYMGVTIISNHFEEIKQMIIHKMGRQVTIYKGAKGDLDNGEFKSTNILYTVITRLEVNKLNMEIESIDPNSFVVMNSIKDIKGGMVKRKLPHKEIIIKPKE